MIDLRPDLAYAALIVWFGIAQAVGEIELGPSVAAIRRMLAGVVG